MDRIDQLQLLPGTKKRLGIKVKGENRFLYVGSAILGAVLVTMFAFGRYESNLNDEIKQINDQILITEQNRNKSEERNLKLVKDRIELTSTLLNDHIYWTRALSSIAGLLQTGIRFKSFLGDVNTESISISVQASNYTVLAKQAAAFLTEENLSDFSINRITPLTSGVLETNFEINFNKENFLRYNK